jgi:4-amino-4-deoxy-L-arabinose transferase-like glycosyltransferase
MTSFYKPTPEQGGQGPAGNAGPGTGAPRGPAPNPPAQYQGLQARPPLAAGSRQQPAAPDGNVILYRGQHFFVSTVARPAPRRAGSSQRPTGYTAPLRRARPPQKERIAYSQTRLMPQVDLEAPTRRKGIPIPAWLETCIVVIGLLISLATHAVNMFNFPLYELDEGTYMSAAWSIQHGQLWPYAYGYGHPPAGWIQLAFLLNFVGGLFSFGNSINTGRVLMLFYSTGMALLIYLIVRRMTASRTMALVGLLIFAFSPMSITYTREVLLDNIGAFWFMLSLYLLVISESRLLYITLAAITFGIAILSKETFVFFIPGMIYGVLLNTTRFQRKFALVAFIYAFIALGSSFVLMAILKGELFPPGWLPWDHHQHLSLIGTYAGQVGRGQNQGSIQQSMNQWIQSDAVLFFVSVGAIAFNVVVGWWKRKQFLFAFLAICYWLLLLRGGVVFDFYIIPLIPLSVVNIVLAMDTVLSGIIAVVRLELVRVVLALVVLAFILSHDVASVGWTYAYTQHPTSVQTDAMLWIRQHVPRNDFIVINAYLFTDLRASGGAGVGDGATYPYAHVYYNVVSDPTIRDDILHDNWNNIDYIVADTGMLADIQTSMTGNYTLLQQAYHHSIQVAQFIEPDHNYQSIITIYKVIHTQQSATALTGPPLPGGSTIIERRSLIE